MRVTPRGMLAVASWGITAVMMRPSFTALIVLTANAGLLAILVLLPERKP